MSCGERPGTRRSRDHGGSRLSAGQPIRATWFTSALSVVVLSALSLTMTVPAPGQVPGSLPLVERPSPPPLINFETDANADGIPDGWFNTRGCALEPRGGMVGPKFFRFSSEQRGRLVKAHLGFGVDGHAYEALILGAWIRCQSIHTGERVGEDPGFVLDFLAEDLKQLARRRLGGPQWVTNDQDHWKRVARRFPVPPQAKEVLMAVGLHGATGTLDIDGMTIDLIPRGGRESLNLVLNGDLELGDPTPQGWVLERGAERVHPGYRSNSAIECSRSGARALLPLSVAVSRFTRLEVGLVAKGSNLRAQAGAALNLFFLDASGRPLPELPTGTEVFRWSGTFDWTKARQEVSVPVGAATAVAQIEKLDGFGSLKLDDLYLRSAPDPQSGAWTPYHVGEETGTWRAIEPSPSISPGTALDFSFLNTVRQKTDSQSPVTVRNGHLSRGGVAQRFFGVSLLAPTALSISDPAEIERLADRLASSGVNLVRLNDLDAPLGPGRSLIDDGLDDTSGFDALALERLDNLIAALQKRGVSIALELLGERRFRAEDRVPGTNELPPGGGPAAAFDPAIRQLTAKFARDLLTHVNPQTGRALLNDPSLAWVTLAGERSTFNLIDEPDVLPVTSAEVLKELTRATGRAGRRAWSIVESQQWTKLAQELRKLGLKAPIAGSSHWRREAEFVEAQAVAELDLIDDRLFWTALLGALPDRQSMLFAVDGGPLGLAQRKRGKAPGKPYVVGQWCALSNGLWAQPFEGADLMLIAQMARHQEWDGLTRRGVFLYPEVWGSGPTGSGGGQDVSELPEVINGIPQVFALLPHSASLMRRGGTKPGPGEIQVSDEQQSLPKASNLTSVPGWNNAGRVVIDSPFTQGVAGWHGNGETATSSSPSSTFRSKTYTLSDLIIEVHSPFGVVMVSAAEPSPIEQARRLLVTVVGRVQPTGWLAVDERRRAVADPGQPPLLHEPIKATIWWRRFAPGTNAQVSRPTGLKATAYALDSQGKRVRSVALPLDGRGARLDLDAVEPRLHWELSLD